MSAPPTPPATAGARIAATRRQLGWTQDKLAEATGVSRSAVAQWETDRAGQLRDNLGRIAGALGVSTDFLLHGSDKFAPAEANTGDERALLRLYRACDAADRAFLLRAARRLAGPDPG